MKLQPSGADQRIEKQHDEGGYCRSANDDGHLDAAFVGLHLAYFGSHRFRRPFIHPAQSLGR
jgi:hypothetical protein